MQPFDTASEAPQGLLLKITTLVLRFLRSNIMTVLYLEGRSGAQETSVTVASRTAKEDRHCSV